MERDDVDEDVDKEENVLGDTEEVAKSIWMEYAENEEGIPCQVGVNLRENVAWEDFSNVENGQKKIWGSGTGVKYTKNKNYGV